MAILPPIKRFILEDYGGIKDIPAFCSKFFYPLNLFLNATYSALNNGLTLTQNTIGLVTSQSSITANSSGIATTTINWPYPQSPPSGVAILGCTLSSLAATYPLISWAYNAGVVTVTMQFVQVTSGAIVTAGAGSYNITFWVSAG